MLTMTTKFFTGDDNEVSYEHANSLTSYKRVRFLAGKKKMMERISDGKVFSTYYYKSAEETFEEILEQFSGKYVTIIESIKYGDKTFEKNYQYNESGGIERKFNYLMDDADEYLAVEKIDLVSGLPISQETKKHYFEPSIFPDREVFRASYLSDGSLELIEYDYYGFQSKKWFMDDGLPGESDVATLRGITGLTESEMAYFLTSDLTFGLVSD